MSSEKTKYEIAYGHDELVHRTAQHSFTPYNMLSENAPEFHNLADGDKIALGYLVQVANIFDRVYKRLDGVHNLPFEKFLDEQIARGNADAKMARRLYDGQRGIFGTTVGGQDVGLAKGIKQMPGRGLYPEHLTLCELDGVLYRMAKSGVQDDQIRQMLNQRSIVLRDGMGLRALDYTDYFSQDFARAAACLVSASKHSTNPDFNEYLRLQARALCTNNPDLDCAADIKWATLQNTPLEFTLTRECYNDGVTPAVSSWLFPPEKKITPLAKDNFGVSVGIVDRVGTDYLLKIKSYLPELASKMPYADKYKQSIGSDNKQTMVDTDVVAVGGDLAAYRGKITIAFNLPNNDKLALRKGGGHRTVYLKQMRESKYADGIDAKLNVLLNGDFHKYFSTRALHDFTILHENMHSLGPKQDLEKLGVYKNTIEEHKADIASLVMLDELCKMGFYTEQQRREIITSWIVAYLYPGPNFSSAHPTRNIMQHNMMIQNRIITFDDRGRMIIDFNRVAPWARDTLENIIRIQLGQDSVRAKNWIDRYAKWTPELASLATKLRLVDRRLNSYVVQPLADMLLQRQK